MTRRSTAEVKIIGEVKNEVDILLLLNGWMNLGSLIRDTGAKSWHQT